MAEQDTGQERTEQPTPRRQQQAREKGQVPRSRELDTALLTLAAAGALMLWGGHLGGSLMELVSDGLRAGARPPETPAEFVALLNGLFGRGLALLAPVIAGLFVVAVLVPNLLGGWSLSAQAMAPKWERMSPIKGLQRIFGVRGLMELVKALLKVGLLGALAVGLMIHQWPRFMALGYQSLNAAALNAADVFFLFFFVLCGGLAVIAAIDVPFQLWNHTRQLRMTHQEVRDEMKETEGRPEVRGRIRQLQREMAQRRMMEEVPKADVVVTNPTHYAVALRYDERRAQAPVVVAKGADRVAERIRAVAGEHRVPLFEAPPLARALYHTTDLNREIPAGLYFAVAQVLAYVYRFRTGEWTPGGPPNPDLPEEYARYRHPSSDGAD